MNAMKASRVDWFELKARSICAEHGWDRLEDLERVSHGLRFQAYQDAIRPLVSVKLRLCQYKIPRYVVRPDGGLGEMLYEWTDEEQKTLADIDELIAAEAKRVGLTAPTGESQ